MNFAQFKLRDRRRPRRAGRRHRDHARPRAAARAVARRRRRRRAASREAGAIVVDRSEYPKLHIDHVGHTTEITGVRAEVVALTSGIRSFTTSPIVFTDLRTARSFMPGLGTDAVTYVLVKVAPGASVARRRARGSTRCRTWPRTRPPQMSERTRTYWSTRTGVGAGFFTTAVLGMIVGFVVVGQILYSGTLQYIREYGTLKAMGARNSMVVRVILVAGDDLARRSGSSSAACSRSACARRWRRRTSSVALFPALYAATASSRRDVLVRVAALDRQGAAPRPRVGLQRLRSRHDRCNRTLRHARPAARRAPTCSRASSASARSTAPASTR